MRALYTAASGMMAQQMNVDVISNNLANVNTTAYKKDRVEFKDMLYETLQKGGVPEEGGKPTNIQVGHGVLPSATLKNFTMGNVDPTENPLDLLIDGEGFFSVRGLNNQTFYTRDGSFKLGATEDGSLKLVTSSGYSVLDLSDNEIIIDTKDPSKITIEQDGSISYMDSEGNITSVEQPIKLVRFLNRAGLESKGSNLYIQTAASGEPISEAEEDLEEGASTNSILRQGFLETSNVQVVEEMVKLIVAQRSYEVNSKSVQAADEMLSMANNLRR